MRREVETQIEVHRTSDMQKEIDIYLELAMKMAMANEMMIGMKMDMEIQKEIDMVMVIGTGMDVGRRWLRAHHSTQDPIKDAIAH